MLFQHPPTTATLYSDAAHVNRYRSSGEIYESIRSALTFAAWIRHIFVIVDDIQKERFKNQWPGKVTVIAHSQIYQDHCCHLPVFNSHSIETHLFQIPGLAEHFLYANDDTFFGDLVTPEMFFHPDGHPVVYRCKDLLLKHIPAGTTESWAYSRVNNSKLLDTLYCNSQKQRGATRDRYEWIHQIKAVCKSYFQQAWEHKLIAPFLQRTSAARFRSPTDIETVGFLLHWKTDQTMTHINHIVSRTFAVKDDTLLYNMFTQINQGHYKLYCINDIMRVPTKHHLDQFKILLSTMLPHHYPVLNTVNKISLKKNYPTGFLKDTVASMGHVGK
jgi:UDP-glucose 4-epimerase